jgi:hypothetical protein
MSRNNPNKKPGNSNYNFFFAFFGKSRKSKKNYMKIPTQNLRNQENPNKKPMNKNSRNPNKNPTSKEKRKENVCLHFRVFCEPIPLAKGLIENIQFSLLPMV